MDYTIIDKKDFRIDHNYNTITIGFTIDGEYLEQEINILKTDNEAEKINAYLNDYQENYGKES